MSFLPTCAFTESVIEITEVNFNVVWEEISDDQLEAYGNFLDNFSVELLAEFFLAQYS